MNTLRAAALLVLLPSLAMAQGAGSGAMGPNTARPVVGTARGNQQPRQPAPPALPGSRAEPSVVAPAERTDMPPTEALFDAINRGDLAAAKDAVGRGADIAGTNVLGLTPLELSVDLGRNEISFLLLSLRGGAGYSTTRAPGPAEPERPQSRAERLAALRAERAERARTTGVAARPPSAAAPQLARLFAGGGGTPVPQAGFLGFDAGR